MAGFEEYTFKPAPMRGEQTWAVRDGHLMRRGASKAFPLDRVTHAVYGSFAYRGTRSTWLHLRIDGDLCKLACNDGGQGEDHQRFAELLIAILDRMPERVTVSQDGGNVFSRAMLLVGILGAIAGAIFLFAGLTDTVRQNEATAIGLGLALIVGFGALSWHYRPWRPPVLSSPRELSERLRGAQGQAVSGKA